MNALSRYLENRAWKEALLCTVALTALILGLTFGEDRCEDARYSRGDVVTHKVTGERAVIGSAFCSGGGESRKRMYEVGTGSTTTPVYWGQYEIQR